MIVACPTCKKQLTYCKTNRFRPFCSERCKLIDFGDWASESHRIEGKDAKDTLFSEEMQSLIDQTNN